MREEAERVASLWKSRGESRVSLFGATGRDGTGRDATDLRIDCGGGGAASFVCCVCRAVGRGTFVVPHA